MTTIAALTVDLIAESSKFHKELDKASKKSNNWAKKVRSSANAVAKSIAAVGTGAAVSLAALYTATASSIDQQVKFADKIGISTEALAGLQHAGELTGVSANTLNMSLQRMTRRVAEAASGTGEAVQALQTLGLSAQQLNQMSPDQQFRAIAGAMGDVGSRSEQVRLAFKLFDAEGTALLNTLDLGVDGLDAMQTEAENFGIALSRVDAAKIEQANDALYRSAQTSKGFAQALTAELAPIVEGISNELVRAANEAGGFGVVASEVVDSLSNGFGVLADSIRGWEYIFAGIGQLWRETAFAFINDIAWIDQAITDLINKIPGMNAAYNQSLQNMTRSLQTEMLAGREALYQLVEQPLPSETIKKYVHQWRELSEVQAIATANAKQYNSAQMAVIDEPAGPGNNPDRKQDRLAEQLAKMEQSFLSETELITLQEQQKQALVEQFRSADLISFEKYQALKQQISVQAGEDLAQLEAQQRQLQLQNGAELFDGLAGMASTFAGEQSGIYRAMFAVSKAFAIADSIIKIQQGIASAAAVPFPANLAAMASVAASTASIVSTISGTNLQGMAHDGIDAIPEKGTWLLDRGERIVDSRTNADLKQFLQAETPANGGGSTQVNIYTQPGETAETRTRQTDQGEIIEVIMRQVDSRINDQLSRGQGLARTLESRYKLSRTGF